MEHLEDSIFNEGSAGTMEALEFAQAVVDMLDGKSNKGMGMTVKWDGAPAVFAGTNPENGKFFVGTKSVFNKTPKINYTNADIDKNHPGSGLNNKLKAALRYLKGIGIKGILQGDVLFTKDDLTEITVDGEKMLAFTPNTITYSFPADSESAKEIRRAKFGVVWHTEYKGRDMSSMKASFGPNVSYLKRSSSVWSVDAAFRAANQITFDTKEVSKFDTLMGGAKSKLKGISKFIDEITQNKFMVSELKIYINSRVREGDLNLSSSAFREYVDTKIQKDIDKLKSQAGKDRKSKVKDDILRDIDSKKTQLDKAFKLYDNLIEIKTMIIRKLDRVKGIGTFIRTEDGYRVTGHEGFVAIDKINKRALKLVDRLEFSKANFTVSKNWVDG
tara:strand:+ start:3861 stop:5021 length:1161 start_codon:yes stop_codon:yes gene_type:complete